MEKIEGEKENVFIVPRLDYLAANATCEFVCSNLGILESHHSAVDINGPQHLFNKTIQSTMVSRHLLSSQNVINFVRNIFDHHFVGEMNEKTRKMLVEEFFFLRRKSRNNMPIEPWVFLECMLDNSFEELKTRVAFPGEDPNFKLIPVIAKRSELLTKLELDFTSLRKQKVEKMIPLITSLSCLQNLTSLNLFDLDERYKSVLKFIGNSCPRLSHLRIRGFTFMPKDILSVIFGELADQMFQESSKSQLSTKQLQVYSPEALTPMCFTLTFLQLGSSNDDWVWNSRSSNLIQLCHVASLVLRAVPLLENMNWFTSFGLAYLIDINSDSGSLSLMSLDYVYLCPVMLQLIPKYCPRLKEVVFSKFEKLKLPGLLVESEGLLSQLATSVSTLELEDELKKWPKIESITFIDIPREHVNVILKVFATSLKRVTFKFCKNIDLMDFIDCHNLETLHILSNSSTLVEMEQSDRLSPISLLPLLKSFTSHICLGLWTLWLEGKSGLTHLDVNCCHIGTKGSNHSDWRYIAKMWPKLETFEMRRCPRLSGFTISMVSNIFLQLTKLKELSIPDYIAKSDPKVAAEIWEEFNNRPAPIRLHYTSNPSSYCLLRACDLDLMDGCSGFYALLPCFGKRPNQV